MRPTITPRTDFNRFLDTLLLRKAYRRPPGFDFLIHPTHMQKILGRPVTCGRDRIEFMRLCGYDYVQVSLYVPATEIHEAKERQRAGTGSASVGGTLGIITGLEQFRSKQWSWSAMANGDLSGAQHQLDLLADVAANLPGDMKILLHTADVFTFAWEMIGFNDFALYTLEAPELIEEVMGSLARATLNLFRRGLEMAGRKVGALLYSDDIAYTEGLFLSPAFFTERLFPVIGQLADMGKTVDAPLIYHSDGKLYPVFDTLSAIGVRGIQPLEPKAMDPLEIKRRWPGRFCLLGNIDLDLMVRGTPDDVERHVREKIDRFNVGGGYMPGVSNTVPDYVMTENYVRMIETIHAYPD